MTAKANWENFLAKEGRVLAEGNRGQLTLEEWLYRYSEIKDDLAVAKTEVFTGLESRIRDRIVERAMDAVAV
mgnify:CR=1 FL=1